MSKTEIVVGTHTDLSGPVASIGVSGANAARLRFDEVNAQGGIHGRKLRFIVEDHQYQVPRAVQGANKLINRDRVFVMLGALGTPMNNAVMNDQLAAGIPNLFPLSAARQMAEPFNRMKFANLSTYYDQIRAGIKWMVENKGKKNLCLLYQDTDFGRESLLGAQDQAKAMNLTILETATNRPTDTDFSAQMAKLRAANCDLIALGTVVRDTILPYGTARRMGWNDVEFIGQSAGFDQTVAGAPARATEGLYIAAGTYMPYRDTASPTVIAWWDAYKQKFGADPNIGSVYGYVGADLLIAALDRAGKDLTTEKLITALEGIGGYSDIFGGPVLSFGPDKRQGTRNVLLFQVQNGRYSFVQGPLQY
ncbi:ABC transporter substrate-binding protein [Ferrovibrio sp.]|uniref:ABC transporter substrate-binding protein n=1 Tax=Ferrovibrio sp. TaxID=1917215 RepID=UPI003D119181